MPVIVVTRLRLKDPGLLDDFFTAAVAALEQAKQAAGHLGSDVLADANNTYWTLTAWKDRGPMRAYVAADPHRGTMARLDTWCDEATFTDWEQASADLPGWPESYRRLVADGQVAHLTQPSPAHLTRDFPPPVEPAAS